MNKCDINYRQSSNKRLLVELTLIQVAQITQPDDADDSSGRRPNRLKSLFQKMATSQPSTAKQVAGAEKLYPNNDNTAEHNNTTNNFVAEETPQKPKNSPKPKIKLGNIGTSFHSLTATNKSVEPTINDTPTAAKSSDEAFTQENLAYQWVSMCNRMPQEKVAIAARMKNITPQITTYPEVEIVVDNEILLDQISVIKNKILATLAQDLKNSNIKLTLRLAKSEEITPTLSKREVFESMKQANPAINKLSNSFNLNLS